VVLRAANTILFTFQNDSLFWAEALLERTMNPRAAITSMVALILMTATVVPSLGCRSRAASAGKGNSETDYKTTCHELPVNDLAKGPEKFKGQQVKYTGKVLVMDFPKDTDKGKKRTGLILGVADETHAIASGQLPVYVTFAGSTEAFIYDTVTIYGEVSGSYDYKSPMIKGKNLPWVEAKYLEKSR
jgi:hypothetical protein